MNPQEQAKFRRNTATSGATYVHQRKRCACGKQITAKDLQRYGCCVACENRQKQAA
jgi:hypothetical protein